MPRNRLTLLVCFLGILSCVTARGMTGDRPDGCSASDSNWRFVPDPPSTDQDLTISYSGFDDEVAYEIDGEGSVRVDVKETGTFTIPKSKLKGKRFVRLKASGGERGYLVIRFPGS